MIMGTGILSKLAPEQKGDIMSFSRKRSFRSFVFIGTELFVLVLLCLCLFMKRTDRQAGIFQTSGDFIKWVDFNVTCEALEQAFRYDVDTCQAEVHLNWVDLLAYLGTRYGGDFSRYKKSDMEKVAEQLINGDSTMEELTKDGAYHITDEMKMQLADFYGNYATEEETAETIRKIYKDCGYVIDTHTSVAATVYKKYTEETGDTAKTVIASTASPYKFTRSVMEAIDEGKYAAMGDFELIDQLSEISGVAVPNAIEEIRNAEVRHNTVADVAEMPVVVKKILGIQ